MNIMLFLLIVSINLIFALFSRIYANPHKNIILETTLPKDKLDDSKVTAIRKSYKRKLIQIALICSLLAIPITFIPYDSLVLLLLFLALFGSVGAFYYLQITYIRKMGLLKKQNGWLVPTKSILIDTDLLKNKNQKLVHWVWFIPSFVLTFGGSLFSLIYSHFSGSFVLLSVISLLCLLMFLVFYYYITRIPVKPLTDDKKVNQLSNDIFRHHWSLLMILSATVISPIAFLPALSVILAYEVSMIFIYGYVILIIVFVGFTFYYLFRLRKKQDQLIAQADNYRFADDDQYWQYGFYINPGDSRILIPDRLGLNMSMNLGRPLGKIILTLTGLLLVVVITFSTLPLFISDFSNYSFTLSTDSTGIELSAPLSKTQSISWNDIESAELIHQLPDKTIKIFGTATENYFTGEFKVNGEESYLLVYAKKKEILKINTQNKIFYFTNKDENTTQKNYQQIQEHLNASK